MAGFIVVFFIVAPLFVLYTAGYRYDWKNKKIKQTGVISIDVEPDDASVFFNNVKIDKRLPIRLSNRAPGQYNLRIEKPGYINWEKEIEVQSKQTTYIKDVTLILDNLPVPLFNEDIGSLKYVDVSPSGKFSIIATNSEGSDENAVKLLNTETRELNDILILPKDKNISVYWSDWYEAAVIWYEGVTLTNLAVVNPSLPSEAKTYSLSITENQPMFQWAKDAREPTLYTLDGVDLVSITFDKYKKITKIKQQVSWYVETENTIWTFDEDSSSIITNDNDTQSISVPGEIDMSRIVDINNNRAIIVSNEQVYILQRNNVAEPKYKKIDTSNIYFNSLRDEWLAWSPWELWIIHNDGGAAIINRTSQAIDSVLPMDEYGLLAIIRDNEIYSYHPGYQLTQKLLTAKFLSAGIDGQNRKIFFFGLVGDNEDFYELEY